MLASYGRVNSLGRLGTTTTSAPSAEGSWAKTLEQYAPTISTVVSEFTDPCKQAAVLQSKIDTLRAAGGSAAQIRTLEAKRQAEAEACGVSREKASATTDVYNLAALATGAVVVVASAGALYILVQAVKGRRKNPRRRRSRR